MPQKCPVCWRLNDDDHRTLIAALICGESLYSIGKRFKVSAMAVSRHWTNCMMVDKSLRERSLARGAHKVRGQLLREAPPVYASAITAWLRGERPTKIQPKPDLHELEKIDRQLKALGKSIR